MKPTEPGTAQARSNQWNPSKQYFKATAYCNGRGPERGPRSHLVRFDHSQSQLRRKTVGLRRPKLINPNENSAFSGSARSVSDLSEECFKDC